MKKIFSAIACTFIFFFVITMTACSCGQKKVVSLTVKEGTLDYTYEQFEEYSFDDLKVIAKYNDGTTEEIGKKDLTIGEFSTKEIKDYKVKISYGGVEIEVTLKVTNDLDELYEINTVEQSADILKYKANSTFVGENDTKEREFVEKTKTYKVGDDNPFRFFPNITVVDDQGTPLPISAYTSISKVYVKEGSNYTLLEGTALTNMVAIDEEKSTYDFTDAAINKMFKIEVRPANLTEVQLLEPEQYTVSLELEVVDGYNVTRAVELGILNNDTTEDKYQPWTTLLANNQVTRPATLNGIVLHNDISVAKTDIPAVYYTGDSYSGEFLKNDLDGDTDLYRHVVADDQTFHFYGNYFTLNFSAIPVIDRSISGEIYSTASVFKFAANEETAPTKYTTTKTYFEDVSMIGNGTLTYADEGRGFGTLIGFKATAHTVTLNNAIIKSFFINTYLEYNNTIFNINNVKGYDAYQNNLFGYGGKNVNITNTEFKRSGGPAMLLQHVDPNNNPNDHYAVANVSNSVIESYVTGDEPWFAAFGATESVAMISLLAGKVSQDYLKDGEINMIGLNMSDGAGLTGATGVQGYIKVDDKEVSNMLYNDSNNANALAIKAAIDDGAGQLPVVVSSDGVIIRVNPITEDIEMINPGTVGGNIAAANYITVYAFGMAICLAKNVA